MNILRRVRALHPSIDIAFKALTRNRLQTGLTMLGIAVGVGTVLAMMAVPLPLASALLAGVLSRFALDGFLAIPANPLDLLMSARFREMLQRLAGDHLDLALVRAVGVAALLRDGPAYPAPPSRSAGTSERVQTAEPSLAASSNMWKEEPSARSGAVGGASSANTGSVRTQTRPWTPIASAESPRTRTRAMPGPCRKR